MERLAGLYARLDLLDEIGDYLSQLTDPFVRGSVCIVIAAELVSQRRGGEADDYFVSALQDAEATVYLADDLRRRVAAGLAANRSYALAVRAIERIGDPTLRLRAAADLAYNAELLGGMRDETREELRRALQNGA
jgi:hypothetical protein